MLIQYYSSKKTLNNDNISNDMSIIGKYHGIKYPTRPLSDVFNNFTPEQIIEMIEGQQRLVKAEAETLVKYGLLSEKAKDDTIKQYQDLFYYEGFFYDIRELKEYITRNFKLINTVINKEPRPKKTIKISRERIRNITGYSPYFTPKRGGDTVYVKRQDDIIKDENKLILILGSRQIGKSLSIAEKCVEESHIPNNDILVGAFTLASTNIIRNYILKFIKNFPEGYFIHNKSERYIQNMKTGSKIYMRTLADDAIDAIRGFTLNTIIVDEAQKVSDYAFVEVLKPTLATTGGKMVLIGTPPRTLGGYFIDNIIKYKRGELTNVSYYEITVLDQPFTHPDVKAEVLAQKDTSAAIRREWFCSLEASDDLTINIPSCSEFPVLNENGFLILGLDPARGGRDRSRYSLIYVYNGKATIILSGFVPEEFKGKNSGHSGWKLQTIFYKRLLERYEKIMPVIKIMDSTGVGDGVVHIFNENGIKINMSVRYTSGNTKTQKGTMFNVSKSILINTMLDTISEGNIDVVEITNKDLLEEITYLEIVDNKGGIGFKSKFFDDIVNATLIANFAIKEKRLLAKSVMSNNNIYIPSGNTLIDTIEATKPKRILTSVW